MITDDIARNRREINSLKAAQAKRATDILKKTYSASISRNNFSGKYVYVDFASTSGEVPLATLSIRNNGSNAILFPQIMRQQSSGQLGWYILVNFAWASSGNLNLDIQLLANMDGELSVYV